jgi:hypothetical protein
MNKILTKDDILNADDLPIIEVKVPEWGGSVYVRKLSVGQVVALGRERVDEKNYIVKALGMSIVDKDGNRLLTNKEAERLMERSDIALKHIGDVVSEINGFSKPVAKTIEEKEEVIKNDPL